MDVTHRVHYEPFHDKPIVGSFSLSDFLYSLWINVLHLDTDLYVLGKRYGQELGRHHQDHHLSRMART